MRKPLGKSAIRRGVPKKRGSRGLLAGAEGTTQWVTRHLARFASRSILSHVDGGVARPHLSEAGPHCLAEIAEERWQAGERARRLEHRTQRPLDLGCAEVGA